MTSKLNFASMTPSVSEFISKCAESSQTAYENFKTVLEALENVTTRTNARVFLSKLQEYVDENFHDDNTLESKYFSFEKLAVDGDDSLNNRLALLQLPSIFSPEEWSFTFYEGLTRYSPSEFQGRLVCELGCGNGWITIALAKRCLPQKIYGLDLNPRAIVCAKINLFLNALADDGSVIYDSDGKNLLDRVEFHVSDLLAHCRERNFQLDRVIGCIPQVLNPDPEATLKFVSETASDDFLYSLSNYCDKQGYVEDQFGLGLIARAVEESVEVLRPAGKIILNVGGRPGSAVLNRLFLRRGFSIKTIWQTKVKQAQDTDIQALVAIEQNSLHRFEFFMGLSTEEPVSARTASAYAKAGGEIAHALTVFEARMENPLHTRKVLTLIKERNYSGARNGLDLAYGDPRLAEEKLSFLSSIADKFHTLRNFPYLETYGEQGFRKNIASFIRNYFRVPVTAKNFVIAPTRTAVIKNIFHIFSPSLALVDKEFARELPSEWQQENAKKLGLPFVLEAPRKADLFCKLLESLRPKIAITIIPETEINSLDSFLRIVDTAKRTKTRLFVDVSQYFELSSQPRNNAVFQFLSEHELPDHVAIVCGLVKNRIYLNLEVCFVLSENQELLENIGNSAEFTYSRAPLLNQFYYDRILYDLINFQMSAARKEFSPVIPRSPRKESSTDLIQLSEACKKAFSHSCIAVNDFPISKSTIRLDYGENDLASPAAVSENIFESFARQNISAAESDPSPELSEFLRIRFGILVPAGQKLHYGNGIAPFFAGIAEHCASQKGTLLIPNGSYGMFEGTCEFFKVNVKKIMTTASSKFKMTPKTLHEALSQTERPWVYLNAPIVNPTGAQYSSAELSDLIAVAHSHQAKIIIDSVFSGLEFEGPHETYSISEWLFQLAQSRKNSQELEYVILGGVSKEFAAGGLRFAFAQSNSPTLNTAIQLGVTNTPHETLCYAMKKLYAQLINKDPSLITDLAEQRAVLRSRADTLCQTLSNNGWEPVVSSGGLFVVAKPTAYLGKQIVSKIPGGVGNVSLTSDNICAEIFYSTQLLLNDHNWTGIIDHCRFVLSVNEKDFEHALSAIEAFYRNLGQR